MLELVKYGLVLGLPLLFLWYRRFASNLAKTSIPAEETPKKPLKTIMQPPKVDLAPPKDDPFTTEALKAYDGTDPSKPIYVAIKGAFADFEPI